MRPMMGKIRSKVVGLLLQEDDGKKDTERPRERSECGNVCTLWATEEQSSALSRSQRQAAAWTCRVAVHIDRGRRQMVQWHCWSYYSTSKHASSLLLLCPCPCSTVLHQSATTSATRHGGIVPGLRVGGKNRSTSDFTTKQKQWESTENYSTVPQYCTVLQYHLVTVRYTIQYCISSILSTVVYSKNRHPLYIITCTVQYYSTVHTGSHVPVLYCTVMSAEHCARAGVWLNSKKVRDKFSSDTVSRLASRHSFQAIMSIVL